MITKTKLQLEIITSNSLTEFKDKVNNFLECNTVRSVDYAKASAEVTAFISYEKVFNVPEDIRDDYHLRGDFYFCEDCPYWGSNYKEGPEAAYLCHKKITPKTIRGCNPACLWFYERLARGDIRPYDKTTNEP